MIRKIENLMAFSKIYNLSGTNAGKDVLFSIGCIHPCLCHVGRQVKMFVFAHSSSFLLLSCLDYFHSVFARVGWSHDFHSLAVYFFVLFKTRLLFFQNDSGSYVSFRRKKERDRKKVERDTDDI